MMHQLLFPEDEESKYLVAFRMFHAENPHVWLLFEKYALEAARAGRGRFGARMIWERMRWYARFETTDAERGSFKLNDHYVPHYARLFMREHPEYDGIFETRRMTSDAR